ncbi:hypothetical protein [Candidatus Poriferisodalis sp.]|uniref:hypothetical protein n=1 Tax=Candidatus Poriferisodalis sp. TaxID=3101277 RepID=UPI003B01230F
MSDTPDRALLESKERDELLQIAAALGAEVPPRARKATIISAILGPDTVGSAAGDELDPTADIAHAPATTTRTRTPAVPGSGRNEPAAKASSSPRAVKSQDAPADEGSPDAADHSPEVPVAEEGNRRSRRRGRDRDDTPIVGETVHCDGLLDLRDEGYGFLRTNGPLPSADDVYVAARQVRQYDLRRGDRITGVSRPAARSERNPALLRLDTLNGEPPPEVPDRPLFDSLTAVLPTEALMLCGPQQTGPLAAIDAGVPIGIGSRGLLMADGTRPTSPLVAAMATAIGERHPDIHLIVLLISERPEDVTELTRRLETSGEVLASTFDRPPEEHLAVAELTLERTKRMAEAGEDVVILFDGLTRLARAYAASGNGRNQPADAVGAAITSTLRFFGGARNLEDAGSVTMVATARTSTGSAADDLAAARLREAANLEIAFVGGLPGSAELDSGEIRLDSDRSFSLGGRR